MELAGLSVGTVGGRLARLRQALADEGEPRAMLVTHPPNVTYLTGFDGESSGLLVTGLAATLFVDPRYRVEAQRTVSAYERAAAGVTVKGHAELPDALRHEVVGDERSLVIEADHVSVTQLNRLAEAVPELTVIEGEDLVLALRLRKDSGEVARIRAACAITDAVIEELVACQPIGWSELEIARFLERRFTDLGAQGMAFDPVIATGANAAMPHARPGNAVLKTGQVLLIDCGAQVDGYKADVTRTVWWGDPGAEIRRAADAMLLAYAAAVQALKSGVANQEVDAVARAVLHEQGFGAQIAHSLGHNVGLEIHERPYLGPDQPGVLEVGNVVTIEPGLYLPGIGGVRIEDTYVITPSNGMPLSFAGPFGEIEVGQRVTDES